MTDDLKIKCDIEIINEDGIVTIKQKFNNKTDSITLPLVDLIVLIAKCQNEPNKYHLKHYVQQAIELRDWVNEMLEGGR